MVSHYTLSERVLCRHLIYVYFECILIWIREEVTAFSHTQKLVESCKLRFRVSQCVLHSFSPLKNNTKNNLALFYSTEKCSTWTKKNQQQHLLVAATVCLYPPSRIYARPSSYPWRKSLRKYECAWKQQQQQHRMPRGRTASPSASQLACSINI